MSQAGRQMGGGLNSCGFVVALRRANLTESLSGRGQKLEKLGESEAGADQPVS
jgi:hypothetical protein